METHEKNANEAQRGSWEIKDLPLYITHALDMYKSAFTMTNFVSSCWG